MIIDRKVHEEELDYLGPVAIAMFIDAGWIRLWPMTWSRAGLRALLNGYGQWDGLRQSLPPLLPPHELHERPDGAAAWKERRAYLSANANIPCRYRR